jgi:steroid delta-isomerase-like uncharacterized protein
MTFDAKAAVRIVIARAWNRGDLAAIDELVAPGYVRDVPGGRLAGREAFKERIRATRAGLPDFTTTVDDIVGEGDHGVILWTATGTHAGTLLGLPPTGRRLTWSGMTWYRLAHGRLVEERELFDVQGLLAQIA